MLPAIAKTVVFSLLATILAFGNAAAAESSSSGTMFVGDFESGDLTGWLQVRKNLPTVQRDNIRSGGYGLKSTLNFFNGDGADPLLRERTEVAAKAPTTTIGGEYWYGFSIYLPGPKDGADNYVPDKYWEIVAQWHVLPDDPLEQNRNPALTLKTSKNGVGGRWYVDGKWSAKEINQKGDYDGSFSYDLGAYTTGVWTDWVFHVKWSYGSDGLLEVWKNGQQVVKRLNAPIAYNDDRGPYFKMGIYKGAWETLAEDGSQLDAVDHRVLYHDEFRMADSSGSYETVAPRGGTVPPSPPTSLVAD